MATGTTQLRKDSIGGASLQGFAGRELVLDEPDLFAIDILDAPLLEKIEFKRLDASRELHLVLFELPALRHVILPPAHPAAIVHFSAPNTPHGVLIEGNVVELDAAWPGAQVGLSCANAPRRWGSVTFAPTADAACGQ